VWTVRYARSKTRRKAFHYIPPDSRKQPGECLSRDAAPLAVLDTNVVLDWLLFRDPRVDHLATALEARGVRWVACPRMRGEFARTLSYAALHKWAPESERLLTLFDQRAWLRPDPSPASLALRCDDPDDQVFLDLALSSGARWLLSHDKALLRLRRRMPPCGPLICRPADWPGT
jgi:putative PIN family toxin of toxin-antitoxin system